MKDIEFSIKRDSIVWILMAICILFLFLCKVESPIHWGAIVYYIRDVLEAIYESGIAGCIFYLLVTAIPLYKSRQSRLRFICDSLTNVVQLLKEDFDIFDRKIGLIKIDDFYLKVDDRSKECLTKDGEEIRNLTNIVISYIDILPPKTIKEFNDIITTNVFLRFYYKQFDELFNQCKLCMLTHNLTVTIRDLETLRDKINKLNK